MVAALFSLTGCGQPTVLFGEVIITDANGEKILDSEIYIDKKNATAADAIIQDCSERRIAYTYENGMFDNFDGIASTKEEGWLLYSDKELATVGAGDLLLEDHFCIEFRYVNYEESFNENGEKANDKEKSASISGGVVVVGPDGDEHLVYELIMDENATAADAVIKACQENKFAYTYENGMFDNFDGIASTMEEGWLLYSKGKLANVGAEELLLEDNFYIEFRYVNYAESFNLE